VWSANQSITSATFDPAQWTLVSADALSGADRTMGFYTPTPNMPGLSLPLLIAGDQYPGVQVMAPDFDQNTGFDVGAYAFNPYDNLSYGPEGRPTYDPGILDTAYSSSYLDTSLGLRPADIIVDGGGYIDVYSSYAPEELVPGSEFDTVDIRVISNNASPEFRIFQTMRGLQMTYIITADTTTELTQSVGITDDTIHVTNAGALSAPNLASNQWGVLTVGAERIMYRERDLSNNTVSGLLRGTAGTAVTAHTVGALVYNMGLDNLLAQQYQNYIVQTTTPSDGSTAVFGAPNITVSTSNTAWNSNNSYYLGDIVVIGYDSLSYDIAPYDTGNFFRAKKDVPPGVLITNTEFWQSLAAVIEVYVGGARLTTDLYTVTAQAPVSVTLSAVPPAGVDVTVLVRRGTWII
jgi:hypothetical protein